MKNWCKNILALLRYGIVISVSGYFILAHPLRVGLSADRCLHSIVTVVIFIFRNRHSRIQSITSNLIERLSEKHIMCESSLTCKHGQRL